MPDFTQIADVTGMPEAGAGEAPSSYGGSKYLKINMAERGEGGIIRYGAGSAGASFRNAQEMNSALSKVMKAMGMSMDEMQHALQLNDLHGVVGENADGSPYIDATRTGSRNPVPAGVTNAQSSPGDTGPGSSGRIPRSGPRSAAGQQAAAAAAARAARTGQAGPGGSGGYAQGSVNNPITGQPMQDQESGFDISAPGGDGDMGPTRLNMSDPLGMSFGGSQPVGGDPRFAGGYFPNAPSITAGLGPESTVGEAIANVISSQEAARNAALGIYGGVAQGHQTDPTLMGARRLAADLQADPFSLSDRTISRIQGQQGDLIGRQSERLGQLAGDRAAASGMGGSGLAERAQERIQTNAARQLGDAQRGLLVEQATRRPQELGQAMEATGRFGMSDYGQRAGIELGAADQIHGQSSFMGDALVSGLLMGGGPPPINVAMGPRTGAFGSVQYSGPASQQPW